MQYRGSAEVLQKQSPKSRKFPFVQITSDSFFFLNIIFKIKLEQMVLMFALMNALYFYSSI